MKIMKISNDLKEQMNKWFQERTQKHISFVEKYCKKAAKYNDEFNALLDCIKNHDQTKFKEPELEPYVYITWKYKCQDDGMKFEDCNPPENMDALMNKATVHHIKNNRHHPEFHDDDFTEEKFNKDNRDGIPDEIVNGTKMNRVDIAEMVCDWCAVSEEKGNTPKKWADQNVNKRWKFTDDQKDLIYELIDVFWE